MSRSTMTLMVTALAVVVTACSSEPSNRNVNVNSNRAVNSNSNARANTNREAGELTREAFEKEKDRIAKEARDLGRKIGSGADDLWIWTKARAALASEDDLRDSTINVDVDQNVVSLTGTVPTVTQKARAESVVRGIAGVKSIANTLKVGPSTGPANANSRPK